MTSLSFFQARLVIRDACHLVRTGNVVSGILLDSPGGDQCVRGHVAVTMLPQPETGFSASGFVRCCTQVFISVPGSHLSQFCACSVSCEGSCPLGRLRTVAGPRREGARVAILALPKRAVMVPPQPGTEAERLNVDVNTCKRIAFFYCVLHIFLKGI